MLPLWTAALILATPPGKPPTFEPDFQAIEAGEAAAIAATGGKVSRKGHTLRIETGHGPRLLRGHPVEGEGFQGYRFAGTLLEGTHALVLVTGWEWWGFLLVHLPTGQTMEIDGPPLLSPNGTHAVVYSMDLGSDYRPNALTVIRFTEKGPRRAFRYVFGDQAGPSAPTWKDDGTITFRWHKVVTRIPRIQTTSAPAKLFLRNGRWILQ